MPSIAAPDLDNSRTAVRPVSRAEIFRAVPGMSRRARNQRQALEALARDPELAAIRRADRRRNIRTVYRIIVRRADWHDRTSRPVIWCQQCRSGGDCRESRGQARACLIRAAGISPSTWKVCRAWLEAHGYLGRVRDGRTPWLRPGVLADQGAANEAAIFVLTVPRSKTAPDGRPVALPRESRPLSPSDRTVVNVPAHEHSQDQEEASARAETHFLEAIARLARISAGQTITEGWIGYLVRPFLAAGWAWRDLSYAVSHDPDNTRHKTSVNHINAPRAWLAWRLSRWIGTDGAPVASHSQELESAAAARRAARAEQRRADAEAEARRVDPQPFAARIRADLGWTRGRARERPE